uniref:Clusterin n=1 Tax=Sphaeramia orbicularis TaxID=375764 RepID=A0A673BNG3_9TELE
FVSLFVLMFDLLFFCFDFMCAELSETGEKYVDEEIKRALLGVKQVKEVMEKKEERHRHLMDALKHSSDKKEGALKLVMETEQKFEEAELQCQDLTKPHFEECRPCLEDTCKAFYTSTCRRGFTKHTNKTIQCTEQVYNQNEDPDQTVSTPNHIPEGKPDLELEADALFRQLLSNVSLWYNQSFGLVKKMQQVLGHSFLEAFTIDLPPRPLPATQSYSSPSFFRTVSLDHILDSVYDFGRNVLEEFSSTVAEVFEEIQEAEEFQPLIRGNGCKGMVKFIYINRYLCRRLRRQVSDCWQLQNLCKDCEDYLLKECPRVQQLHSEREEMYMLLNASRQQHDDRLQLVQKHTADTQRWLSNMYGKYGWVSRLSNNTVDTHAVVPQQQLKNNKPRSGSSVVVTVLDSSPFTVTVPAELSEDDPAFIQYVAQEALTHHKGLMQGTDPQLRVLLFSFQHYP